jgi:hypothetical protein
MLPGEDNVTLPELAGPTAVVFILPVVMLPVGADKLTGPALRLPVVEVSMFPTVMLPGDDGLPEDLNPVGIELLGL